VLAKLLKFILITRFSKPLLILIGVILAYNILIGTFSPRTGTGSFSPEFAYYGVTSAGAFLALSVLFGGLFILKSDRDYLLTLPLNRRALSLALFIAQFLGSGMSLLFFYGFFIATVGNAFTLALLGVDLALLAAIVTSLGVISNIVSGRVRAIFAGPIGIWCLSTLYGIPYTPVSMFTGHVLTGSLIVIGLGIVTIPIAFSELSNVEFGSMRSLLRSTSTEYKKNLSFQGRGSIGAIYSYHLSFLELAGRFNIGGTTSYRTTRVKTSTVAIISSIVAMLYFVFVSLLSSSLRISSTAPVLILPIALGLFIVVLASQATFSNERAWLAFTAMDPAKYLRHLLLSRILSTLAISGPFVVANFALYLINNQPRLGNSFIILLVTVPASSIIVSYLAARVGVVQQVREEGMMPGEFNIRQMVVVLISYVLIGLMVASAVSLLAAMVIALVVTGFAGILMGIKNVWRGIVYRLTEKGFV
jgi:hypothetical protein